MSGKHCVFISFVSISSLTYIFITSLVRLKTFQEQSLYKLLRLLKKTDRLGQAGSSLEALQSM